MKIIPRYRSALNEKVQNVRERQNYASGVGGKRLAAKHRQRWLEVTLTNTTNKKLKKLEDAARAHRVRAKEDLPGSETQKIGITNTGTIDATGIGLGADNAETQELTRSCTLR